VVQTARQHLLRGRLGSREVAALAAALHNPLIQSALGIERGEWDAGKRPPAVYPHVVPPSPATVELFAVTAMSDDALLALSRDRLLALSLDEMRAVRDYFAAAAPERRAAGLPDEATDVELEMIAQTWSEHCKHKIFAAEIRYRQGGREEVVDSLFRTYIRGTTERIARDRPFLKSVFHDNSGVIQVDDDTLLAFKVETHNSPSALDPYGGAITGIVGVNRDILGTGQSARPIFNTNVLCFADPSTPPAEVPAGLLHPARVMEGVHHGIVDGGNQSGIPVVAGAFVFDESYLGKPLVFCGTGGLLPAELNGRPGWAKSVSPGDLAVMVGGRIGKDGIHGATFSSLALDEASPTSAVQIGDPIIQKRMTDLLMEARGLGLFAGLTDNGAGGLSSSLGEMALEPGGVRVYLDRCPLKYAGLAPWEILLSESQERMSLAVAPARIEALLALARRRGVEAAVIGEFTDSGFVEAFHEGRPVARVSCRFLADGAPRMRLVAEWDPAPRPEASRAGRDLPADLLALLRDPNIASKEELVRQYDHEVQGRSVIKPFCGAAARGPTDGAVLRLKRDGARGITVTHGICPRYGDHDARRMAMCAVDEALRAHVACGGDPDQAAALDNFCWPDPVASPANPDGPRKLAQLVRACRGLQEACLAYSLALISGKDSMKNDAFAGGRKISVRPTLLVSLVGIIEDVRRAVSTDFKAEGDLVYLLGDTRGELGGSAYERLVGEPLGEAPEVETASAAARYRALHGAMRQGLVASCHDLSEGGLAAALSESALGGDLGADVDLAAVALSGPGAGEPEADRLLFCETPSRFLLSVRPGSRAALEKRLAGCALARLGVVTADRRLRITRGAAPLLEVSLDALCAAWGGKSS
jgi:phosphoribosylformylglycinamidine synthase